MRYDSQEWRDLPSNRWRVKNTRNNEYLETSVVTRVEGLVSELLNKGASEVEVFCGHMPEYNPYGNEAVVQPFMGRKSFCVTSLEDLKDFRGEV